MVYFDKKKRKFILGNPPLDKKFIKIESPPKEVPTPFGATFESWVDLKQNQCQFALDSFFDGPSNQFPCCGLQVAGGIGLGRRFCSYHEEVAKNGVK